MSNERVRQSYSSSSSCSCSCSRMRRASTSTHNGFVSSPAVAPPRRQIPFPTQGEGFRTVFVGFVWVRFCKCPIQLRLCRPSREAASPCRRDDRPKRDFSGHFETFPRFLPGYSLVNEHASISTGARARLTHGCARNFSKPLDLPRKNA